MFQPSSINLRDNRIYSSPHFVVVDYILDRDGERYGIFQANSTTPLDLFDASVGISALQVRLAHGGMELYCPRWDTSSIQSPAKFSDACDACDASLQGFTYRQWEGPIWMLFAAVDDKIMYANDPGFCGTGLMHTTTRVARGVRALLPLELAELSKSGLDFGERLRQAPFNSSRTRIHAEFRAYVDPNNVDQVFRTPGVDLKTACQFGIISACARRPTKRPMLALPSP
jgi:hypothetical protein